MLEKLLFRSLTALAAAALLATAAQAATIEIETEPVRNPGNANDDTGYGGVDYFYEIGKYEVTTGEYTAFLNGVAATDTYGLYNTSMWSSQYGCKIERSGSSGSFSYSALRARKDRPVNYVSWGDAARFANWLHNGQPTGPQGLNTTEGGAYFLNGATSNSALMAVTRKSDAVWWIPSEDEWYKAAYHKNDGVTDNYFDYPTGSDSVPSNVLRSPDPGNNANFRDGLDFTIGSPYYMTITGAFENSESPYGTFDQGGNLWEWNETAIGSSRGLRGGFWYNDSYYLHASARYFSDPTYEGGYIGFRVASIPEPGSITLLASGLVAGLIWWRRRK